MKSAAEIIAEYQRALASKGGVARAKALSAERRSEIATKASAVAQANRKRRTRKG